ncbi:MAG: alpha/beta hydrolase [Chlamydiota bacterium]
MTSASVHNFQASWNEQNVSLNPKATICRSILSKMKNILFYLPNSLIATCINPRNATQFSLYENSFFFSRSFSRQIITPDHVPLQARIDTIRGSNEETPTVILFNPLGTNDGIYNQFRITLLKKHCNVVSFDHRGLGTTWRTKDLVLDGDSVYQFVTKELKISTAKVHFFGHSLGGAIAAQVKSLHPESLGKYVGDRTFASFFSLITEKCCIARFGYIIKIVSSLFARILIAFPLFLLGWDFNTKEAFEKMQGKRLTIIHPNDFLIPSLASAAQYKSRRITLDPSIKGPTTHFASIDEQRTEKKQEASILVADFLAKD